MRIHNLQFAKGSIVFAKFENNLSYLNNRPLLVVSEHIPIFDSVWVVKLGSRGKPGININLWNYHSNKPLGDREQTTIYPYNIYTVSTQNIISTIGMLDRVTMRAVDEAIDYFMGRSDIIPEFLRGFEEEINGIDYQYATDAYVNCNEATSGHYRNWHSNTVYRTGGFKTLGDDTLDKEDQIPAPPLEEVSDQHPMLKVNSVSRNAHRTTADITTDMVAAFLTQNCTLGVDGKTSVTLLADIYNSQADKPVSTIAFSKTLIQYLEMINSTVKKTTYNGKVVFDGLVLDNISVIEDNNEFDETTGKIPEIDYNAFSEKDSDSVREWATKVRYQLDPTYNCQQILNTIGSKSASYIVSRYASLGAIQQKYGFDSTDQALELRNKLEEVALSIGNALAAKLEKGKVTVDSMSEFEQIALVLTYQLYGFSASPRTRVKVNKMIRDVEKYYAIDFTDTLTWGGGAIQ